MQHYTRVMTIVGKGTAPGEFTTMLRGVCVDAAGLVYAVGDRSVKVFDAAGKFVRQWAILRPAYCIAVQADSAGQVIWVGESGQVERFDAQGKPSGPFRDGDRLSTVTAIGFHGEDVLIGDATARCIRRYHRDGTWSNDIGKDNNTQGFVIPNGCLDFGIDADGVIHATNPAKHRIERYRLTGELLGHFGKFGMQRPEDFGGCCNPTNIALLPGGGMAVTEKAPPRLKVFDRLVWDRVPTGQSDRQDADPARVTVVGPEAFDAQCKNMRLAVDVRGRIYVTDTERLCVQVFAPTAGASSMSAPGSQNPARTDSGGGR